MDVPPGLTSSSKIFCPTLKEEKAVHKKVQPQDKKKTCPFSRVDFSRIKVPGLRSPCYLKTRISVLPITKNRGQCHDQVMRILLPIKNLAVTKTIGEVVTSVAA